MDPLNDLPIDFDHLGASLENAARLQRAGVRIAFSGGDTPQARLVRQRAGNAVAHGLPLKSTKRVRDMSEQLSMGTKEQQQALMAIARCATPADLSILQAALTELRSDRPILLTTVPGSNNDKLWSQMAALGWMQATDPVDARILTRLYVINPAVGDVIGTFLADNARSIAMTAIINELRTSIPPTLIDAVHGADGTPADLAILLGSIVERTMRRAIKPELHDEFLREVAKVANGMRSD